ncbi:hypothetical protein K2X89_05095, partial [Myxococcota bacterium]|nr:hypothetical protein [Myxococcota bacterium]
TRLASLSTEAVRFSLVTAEGARIGGRATAAPERIAAGIAALGGEEDGAPASIDEEGGLRSLVRPASPRDEHGSSTYLWAETDAPTALLMAGLFGPWPLVVGGLGLLGAVVWLREGDRAAGEGARAPAARAGGRSSRGSLAAESHTTRSRVGGDSEGVDGETPTIRRERFVLRDWLADVRGCLEREAASRGLTLVLRCERTLPREIEQDPHWLGGLLVSLGRDALDATRATRVALEVSGGAGGDLRFDLDAGAADLEPVGGMGEIASRLGGSLEKTGRGRLALVLPDALA